MSNEELKKDLLELRALALEAAQEALEQWKTELEAREIKNLRDHFAGQALAGICAHKYTWGAVMPSPDHYRMDSVIETAYAVADAMLKARGE